MFVALALAAAGVAAVPPVTLAAHAVPSIPARVVAEVIDEAAAVWRALGVTIVGRIDRDDRAAGCRVAERQLWPVGPVVRVRLDDGPATLANFSGTIGSIQFDASNTPVPEIHLSYSNAFELMVATYGHPAVSQMPAAQQRMFLSRALGRALAHEIGHYVLGSKAHTQRGLMKPRLSATDLFGPRRDEFNLTSSDRATAVAHLTEAGRLAWR
jgi:hypothetical protein